MDTSDVWQSQWEKFLEKENDNVDDKFDLDKYLEDNVEEIKDLNILTWWKALFERYSIVTRIARDVLAIPTSIVASKSVLALMIVFLIVIDVFCHQRLLKLLFLLNNGYVQHLQNARLKIFYKKCKISR